MLRHWRERESLPITVRGDPWRTSDGRRATSVAPERTTLHSKVASTRPMAWIATDASCSQPRNAFHMCCFPWAGFVPTRLGIAGCRTPSTKRGGSREGSPPAIGAIRSGPGTGMFRLRSNTELLFPGGKGWPLHPRQSRTCGDHAGSAARRVPQGSGSRREPLPWARSQFPTRRRWLPRGLAARLLRG